MPTANRKPDLRTMLKLRTSLASAGEIAAEEESLHQRKSAFPKAFLILVIALLAFEGWLNTISVDRLVYGSGIRGVATEALTNYLRAGPETPDVLFIGSSRVRDAILPQVISERINEKAGVEPSIHAYGMAAAQMKQMSTILKEVARRDMPELIVVGIEPRALSGGQAKNLIDFRFLRFNEWREQIKDDRAMASIGMSHVLERELAGHLRSFAFRQRFAAMFLDASHHALEGNWSDAVHELTLPPTDSPMSGGKSWYHQIMPNLSAQKRTPSIEQVQRYVRTQFKPVDEFKMHPVQTRAVDEIIELCKERKTRLIFVEMPVTTLLEENWPPQTREKFEAYADELRAKGAEVFTAQDLEPRFDLRFYREQSHYNLRGATAISKRLAQRVVLPVIRGRAAQEADR